VRARARARAPGGTIDDRRDRRTSIDDRSIDAIARSTDDRSPIARSADRAIRRSGDSPIRRFASPRRDETDGRATARRPHRDDGATDEDAVRVDAKG